MICIVRISKVPSSFGIWLFLPFGAVGVRLLLTAHHRAVATSVEECPQQPQMSTLGMKGGHPRLVKSFFAQRQEVKKGMQEDVTDRKRWSLIEMKWFDHWKAYVNFDGSGDGTLSSTDSTPPGEIDNSPLCEVHTELRRDIVENVDFVLMPEKVAATLFEIFGGGPRLDRSVTNHGSVYAPLFKIDLYPIRFQCQCITNSGTEEDTLYFSEKQDVDIVMDMIRRRFKVRTDSRFWVRLGSGYVEATVEMAVDGNTASRKLTAEVTDTVDGYRLVRGVDKVCIHFTQLTAPMNQPHRY